MLRRLLTVTLCVAASGCAFFGGGSLTDKATHTERMQCDAAAPSGDLRAVAATPVLQVEGRYDSHESGISKSTATRIVVRPPEGVSASRMTRVLQCHNARVVLGRAGEAELPNDPYVLPGTWVDNGRRPGQTGKPLDAARFSGQFPCPRYG
jgi:hypothetical protein